MDTGEEGEAERRCKEAHAAIAVPLKFRFGRLATYRRVEVVGVGSALPLPLLFPLLELDAVRSLWSE